MQTGKRVGDHLEVINSWRGEQWTGRTSFIPLWNLPRGGSAFGSISEFTETNSVICALMQELLIVIKKSLAITALQQAALPGFSAS